MSNETATPTDLACALGRLLRAYIPDGPLSAHETVEFFAAFQRGFDDEKRGMVQIDLPLVSRIEDDSSLWDGLIPDHQIKSKHLVQLFVGADFLSVEISERGSNGAPLAQKPWASVSIDHAGCGHVRIKTNRGEKPKDHPLAQWM